MSDLMAYKAHLSRQITISDERRDSAKKVYRVGVGCEVSAQSDALRVCGDAAHPARQESRPARRRAVKNRLLCPAPDNSAPWWPRERLCRPNASATGAIQHGKPKYRHPSGYHGKGGLVGRSLIEAA